jgi:hypothetical protein
MTLNKDAEPRGMNVNDNIAYSPDSLVSAVLPTLDLVRRAVFHPRILPGLPNTSELQ